MRQVLTPLSSTGVPLLFLFLVRPETGSSPGPAAAAPAPLEDRRRIARSMPQAGGGGRQGSPGGALRLCGVGTASAAAAAATTAAVVAVGTVGGSALVAAASSWSCLTLCRGI